MGLDGQRIPPVSSCILEARQSPVKDRQGCELEMQTPHVWNHHSNVNRYWRSSQSGLMEFAVWRAVAGVRSFSWNTSNLQHVNNRVINHLKLSANSYSFRAGNMCWCTDGYKSITLLNSCRKMAKIHWFLKPAGLNFPFLQSHKHCWRLSMTCAGNCFSFVIPLNAKLLLFFIWRIRILSLMLPKGFAAERVLWVYLTVLWA